MNADRYVAAGSGMGSGSPFDLICGGCGEVLLTDTRWVESWQVDWPLIEIEHHSGRPAVVHVCEQPLFGRVCFVVMDHAMSEEMHRSVGP